MIPVLKGSSYFMPYFYDTNVIIGYLFPCGDRLGTRARDIINGVESNHAGYTTYMECFGNGTKSGRCNQIQEEISDELLCIKAKIEEMGVIKFRESFRPHKYPRTGLIVQKYLQQGRLDDSGLELVNLPRKYELDYVKRKNQILDTKICTWHPRRQVDDKDLALKLREHIKNYCDVQVLLDAHDAGHKVPNLTLVTDDGKDIVGHRGVIMQYLTNIVNIIHP